MRSAAIEPFACRRFPTHFESFLDRVVDREDDEENLAGQDEVVHGGHVLERAEVFPAELEL